MSVTITFPEPADRLMSNDRPCVFPHLSPSTSYKRGCKCSRCVRRFACASCGAPVWLEGVTCIPCRTTPVIDRVLARTEFDPITRCWLWTGSVNQWGYGRIHVSKQAPKMRVVHRVVWEFCHGPVEAPLQLDHLCNVPRCCNPSHLEPVTPKENTRRSHERRKALRA